MSEPSSRTDVRPSRCGLRSIGGATTALAALIVGVMLVSSRSPAATTPAGGVDDPVARRLMETIERQQRTHDRVFSMDVALTGPGYANGRRILGVVRGDPRRTDLLYVMTTPRLLRGSALLIHDEVDPRSRDRLWIALPGLATLRELDAGSLRMMVPGTGLTYEESRGWIATDKYRFTTGARTRDEVTIEAWPRSDSLSRLLGLSRRMIRVDSRRRVVLAVRDFDRAGTRVKTYEATKLVALGGAWFPSRVETDHHFERVQTVIDYDYAPLGRPAPPALFSADSAASPPIDRLLGWMRRAGWERRLPDTLTTR